MTRVGWRAALVIALSLTLPACGLNTFEKKPREQDRVSEDGPSWMDLSPQGRLAFGCALQRGAVEADGVTSHYIDSASRELFRSALSEDHQLAVAASLWQANDRVIAHRSDRTRSRLLGTCAAAGYTNEAGLAELRSYMCSMSANLGRERPSLDSFGPEESRAAPGDPRRGDAAFVGKAEYLLALEVDPKWLDEQNLLVAMADGTGEDYRDALHHIARMCATG